MSISTDIFIQSYSHLKDRSNPQRAMAMLKHIDTMVKPIMRKHRWTLPILAEFFPSEENLLGMNVNRGQKILLRLRPGHSPDSFYEEEQVVLVMLHELTHNVHGPHDEHFYKFLSGLEDEYDALKRSGYSGEAFHTPGNRIGSDGSRSLPPHLAKLKALKAAEKRKVSSLNGIGGILGGTAKNMSPRELAAQAAERRVRDSTACGSGPKAQQEVQKAANESITNVVIDLTGDSDSDSESKPKPKEKSQGINAIASSSKPTVSASKNLIKTKPGSKTSVFSSSSSIRSRATAATAPYPKRMPIKSEEMPSNINDGWTCAICTLENTPLSLQCGACSSDRPLSTLSGWICLSCGESEMPHEFWTCRSCGTMKNRS